MPPRLKNGIAQPYASAPVRTTLLVTPILQWSARRMSSVAIFHSGCTCGAIRDCRSTEAWPARFLQEKKFKLRQCLNLVRLVNLGAYPHRDFMIADQVQKFHEILEANPDTTERRDQ